MNQRNVEALVEILSDGELLDKQGIFDSDREVEAVAQFLASRGVLVPSVLTEMEAHEVAAEYGDGLADHLERIAKGQESGEAGHPALHSGGSNESTAKENREGVRE